MPRKHRDVFVDHVVAACALSIAACEVAKLEDLEGEDLEIVLDDLACAALELARAVSLMHPEWGSLEGGALAAQALKIFRRSRPDLHESVEGVQRLVRLLLDACERGTEAIAAARFLGFSDRDEIVIRLSNGLLAIIRTANLMDLGALQG